jgi:signal peptidase I
MFLFAQAWAKRRAERSCLERSDNPEMDPGGQVRTDAAGMHLGREAVVRCEGPDFEELAVDLLKSGHRLRFRARGSSMHPLVRDGDILVVRPVNQDEMKVGDVVLYRAAGAGIVAHRIVEKHTRRGQGFLVVRGDATGRPDPQVLWSQVLGRVASIERRGRTIVAESWTSRHAAPFYRGLFRLKRRCYLMLRAAGSGLRRVTGVSDQR